MHTSTSRSTAVDLDLDLVLYLWMKWSQFFKNIKLFSCSNKLTNTEISN